MTTIKYEDIFIFHKKIFSKIGLDDYSNNCVSRGLCDASIRGVDSHGIRLLGHYVNSAEKGRKNKNPNFGFKKTFPSIGVLDADDGFGLAAGNLAIDHCINIASEYGIGVVSVINSSHCGAMANMAIKAAKKGFISIAFTHANSLMLTHNGKRAYFGTNPICVAVPRDEKEPFCIDMATSMISWNKLISIKNTNSKLDENLAADENGKSTTNPLEAKTLFPAGSYKGFGLASVVEILCGVYSGMAFGRKIPDMFLSDMSKPRKLGQFYIVLRVDGCIDKEFFLERMQTLTNEIRSEPSFDNEKVQLPNDREIKISQERLKNGIPLDDATKKDLIDLSKKYNVSLKFN